MSCKLVALVSLMFHKTSTSSYSEIMLSSLALVVQNKGVDDIMLGYPRSTSMDNIKMVSLLAHI